MKKNLLTIAVAFLLLFIFSGCYEERYNHGHHNNGKNTPMPPKPPVDIDVNVR
jgi:hypothetical protein